MAPRALFPFDYEEIAVQGAVVSLTAAKVNAAHEVLVEFNGGPIRYTTNGTTPSSTLGHTAYDGKELVLGLPEALGLRMIRADTVNGTARVTFKKRV